MIFKNITQRSWWERDLLARPADLLIIGSGITGLATALFYKRQHPAHRVMVLDRGFWPTGATGRNAGFACFGSAGELLDDMQQEAEAGVKDRLRLRLEGLALLKEELGSEEIGFEMTGGYEIFDDTNDPHFRESLAQLPRFSRWVEELTGEADTYEFREINGFPSIFNRLEGYLHSGKMLQALVRKVQQAGVEIRWNTPVTEVHQHGAVLQDGLALEAAVVLCATNGYTSTLLGETQVKPARGYVFVTNPLQKLPWHGSCHYNRGYVYFRDLGDRLLIGGARDVDKAGEESILNEINPKIKNWLVSFVNDKLGIDPDWQIDQEWTGVMGFGATKTPECRRHENGVYTAAGLGGMGVAIGMKLGQRTASLITNSTNHPTPHF
ncbi:MAG: FAD-dependent oxidoreductase [Balneolales bacterium]|nr:FAD-dependent oxidoreductase [Balneolales bacterium]